MAEAVWFAQIPVIPPRRGGQLKSAQAVLRPTVEAPFRPSESSHVGTSGFGRVFALGSSAAEAPWRKPANSRRSWCSDVVGYSRLAGADEDRILARLQGAAQRSDRSRPSPCITGASSSAPATARSSSSAASSTPCAARSKFRTAWSSATPACPRTAASSSAIGIHLGDVVEESDGDLMGDGVNIAARLEGIAEPGAICLSEDAYRQVKGRLDLAVTDLGPTQLKNIAEPVRAYSLQVGVPAVAKPATPRRGRGARRQAARPKAPLALGRRRRADRARGRRVALSSARTVPSLPIASGRAGALHRRAASEQSLGRRGAGLSRGRADRRTDDLPSRVCPARS